MDIFKKIYFILDSKDKKMFFVFLFIIAATTFMELLNVVSIIGVANIIINQNEFLKYLNKYSFFRDFFIDKEQVYIIKFFVLSSIFLLFLKSVFLVTFFWIKNKYLFFYEVKLRRLLLNKYLDQPYNFFLKFSSGDLIRNINTEVGNFRYVSLQIPIQAIFDIFLVGFIVSSIIVIKPYETISLILILSVILGLYYLFFKPYLTRWGQKKVEREAKIISVLQDTFRSIKEVLIYKKKEVFLSKYYDSDFKLSNINVINYFVAELPKHLFEFIGLALLLLYLYFIQLTPYDIESLIFTLSIFSISLYKLIPSFSRLSHAFQTLRMNKPVVEILYNDLKLSSNLSADSSEKIDFSKEIYLKNVSYSFEKSKIIENLNLKIKKNESTAIVGASGSGKSTILNLIMGLLKPTEGGIFCDDKNININLIDWQKKIAFIDQNIYLHDDTVKNNITLYEDNNQIDMEKLNNAIKFASLEEVINKKIDSLDFRVGENNKFLSGGEAQRIGIARAIYKNAEILIFDEFTSNLDRTNKKLIFSNLEKIRNKKTIIAVTHDEEILEFFDKVYNVKELLINISK